MELPSLLNCRCWSLKATGESERVSEFLPSGPGKPQSIYLYIMHNNNNKYKKIINNNNNPPLVSRVLQMRERTLSASGTSFELLYPDTLLSASLPGGLRQVFRHKMCIISDSTTVLCSEVLEPVLRRVNPTFIYSPLLLLPYS
eukprot:gene1570-953_t